MSATMRLKFAAQSTDFVSGGFKTSGVKNTFRNMTVFNDKAK